MFNDIGNCDFGKEVGNGFMKIHNVFDQDGSKIAKLDTTNNSILISSGRFELDKSSKTSISYVNEIESSKLELIDCNFAGKMAKGIIIITSKILFKFEYENDSAVKTDAFEADQLIISDVIQKNTNEFNLFSFNLLIIIFLVALVIIIYWFGNLLKKQYYFDDSTE